MRIALLHNPRPLEIEPTLPDDTFEEYDTMETISAICAALAPLGVDAVPIVADRPASLAPRGKTSSILPSTWRRARADAAAKR